MPEDNKTSEPAPKPKVVKDAEYYRQWRAKDKARMAAQETKLEPATVAEPVAFVAEPVAPAPQPEEPVAPSVAGPDISPSGQD